jgi:hypothetical protein
MKSKVIEKFKAHQTMIKTAKQERNKSNTHSKKHFNPKKYKAIVKLLVARIKCNYFTLTYTRAAR